MEWCCWRIAQGWYPPLNSPTTSSQTQQLKMSVRIISTVVSSDNCPFPIRKYTGNCPRLEAFFVDQNRLVSFCDAPTPPVLGRCRLQETPRRVWRTSLEVVSVIEFTITTPPFRRFIAGNTSSPALLMLIAALMSLSIMSFSTSSQYSRTLQSVNTNSSRYESNWELYAGFFAITLAPAFSAMWPRISKNWPNAASAHDRFKPDLADCPFLMYAPVSSCFGALRRVRPFRLRSSWKNTFLPVFTNLWAVLYWKSFLALAIFWCCLPSLFASLRLEAEPFFLRFFFLDFWANFSKLLRKTLSEGSFVFSDVAR